LNEEGKTLSCTRVSVSEKAYDFGKEGWNNNTDKILLDSQFMK
jgi:hypothetical protein